MKISVKIIAAFVVTAFIAAAAGVFCVSLINSNVFLITPAVLWAAAAACVLALSIIAGFAVSRPISRRVKDVTRLVESFVAGDTDKSISAKSKDETGKLASLIDKDVREIFKETELSAQKSQKRFSYQEHASNLLIENLTRLAEGELNCDFVLPDPDEITLPVYTPYASVGKYLYESINAIKSYMDETADALNKIANGNIDIRIDSEYKGQFIKIKDSINAIADKQNQLISDIKTAATQVTDGSRQVSDGNQQISQGAAEQASSIEELSASITQIAQQINSNAKIAGDTAMLAGGSKDEAVAGNEKMKHMLSSMDEINESSANISKIIKVIDDIAFQTNILALNAAVEAARAGVHGKGFAVVAEEVRNLAARSAQAASETAALIEGSINKVDAGTAIAKETAAALSSIVEGAEESVRLLSEIAQASEQQAAGIDQINKGIEQLSQVVQANTATAQEGAAASQELSSQAEMLIGLIGNFKLRQKSAENERPAAEVKKPVSDNSLLTFKKAAAPAADKTKAPAVSAARYSAEKPRIVLGESDFGKY